MGGGGTGPRIWVGTTYQPVKTHFPSREGWQLPGWLGERCVLIVKGEGQAWRASWRGCLLPGHRDRHQRNLLLPVTGSLWISGYQPGPLVQR